MNALSQTHVKAPAAMPAPPKQDLGKLLAWAILLALLVGSWRGADMRPLDLLRDSGNMLTYAASFFPPDFND